MDAQAGLHSLQPSLSAIVSTGAPTNLARQGPLAVGTATPKRLLLHQAKKWDKMRLDGTFFEILLSHVARFGNEMLRGSAANWVLVGNY
jgi:hypothetical protein